MDKRRNIFIFHQQRDHLGEKIKKLENISRHYGFHIVENSKEANIIVSVGGDGTFLQAVRKSGFRNDCLYIGINSGEQQSLYSDFHIDDQEGLVEAVSNSKIEVRRYPIIEVTIDEEPPFYCLNECTVRSNVVRTFELDVFINDFHFETFRGDGMVISTPTGSTAYNKSIGGAVVDPLLRAFQVTELASLNNNQYRTLGTSFVLSGNHTLTLEVVKGGNHFPIVSMDNEALGISHVERIQVKLSDGVIKTVKLKNNSFWHKVQRTFL